MLFCAAKFYLYGWPASDVLVFYVLLLAASLGLLKLQREIYRRILNEKKNFRRVLPLMAATKLGYMFAWLTFLFWPLQSPYFYDHLLGYFFIFCAIGLYASTSAVLLKMFFWDIGVQIFFAAVVTMMNLHVQETPYAGVFVFLFGLYAIIAGWKINQTTTQLVDSKYALEKSARSATLATRAKSDFLAVMSHEIRTPMSGIMGMLEFLNQTDLSDEQKDYLDTVKECSKTLLNTLNDVLDLSRMEAGKLAINKTNFDCHQLFSNAVKVLRPAAEEKGLTLIMTIADDLPRQVYSDPNRVHQMVINLLNNAVKFTHQGSITLTVSFLQKPAPSLHVEVRDTGIGISPEEQAKLFQEFSQADGSISRQYGGSGLGLSITKRLVELMGGTVGVTSRKEQGSTFWFRIPYQAPIAANVPAASALDDEIEPMSVLLVEDNKINQMITQRLLEKKGHRVTLAQDGETAIRFVRRENFDLILMDLSLPVRSGIDTARDIRRLGERQSEIPIIAFTANVMPNQLKMSREANMKDCLIKPYSPDQLYKMLAKYGTRKQAPSIISNSKLRDLAEEFGPEYMDYLLSSSLQEMRKLVSRATNPG